MVHRVRTAIVLLSDNSPPKSSRAPSVFSSFLQRAISLETTTSSLSKQSLSPFLDRLLSMWKHICLARFLFVKWYLEMPSRNTLARNDHIHSLPKLPLFLNGFSRNDLSLSQRPHAKDFPESTSLSRIELSLSRIDLSLPLSLSISVYLSIYIYIYIYISLSLMSIFFFFTWHWNSKIGLLTLAFICSCCEFPVNTTNDRRMRYVCFVCYLSLDALEAFSIHHTVVYWSPW